MAWERILYYHIVNMLMVWEESSTDCTAIEFATGSTNLHLVIFYDMLEEASGLFFTPEP